MAAVDQLIHRLRIKLLAINRNLPVVFDNLIHPKMTHDRAGLLAGANLERCCGRTFGPGLGHHHFHPGPTELGYVTIDEGCHVLHPQFHAVI